MTKKGWREFLSNSVIVTCGFAIGAICGIVSGTTSNYFWSWQIDLWLFMLLLLFLAHFYLYRDP